LVLTKRKGKTMYIVVDKTAAVANAVAEARSGFSHIKLLYCWVAMYTTPSRGSSRTLKVGFNMSDLSMNLAIGARPRIVEDVPAAYQELTYLG